MSRSKIMVKIRVHGIKMLFISARVHDCTLYTRWRIFGLLSNFFYARVTSTTSGESFCIGTLAGKIWVNEYTAIINRIAWTTSCTGCGCSTSCVQWSINVCSTKHHSTWRTVASTPQLLLVSSICGPPAAISCSYFDIGVRCSVVGPFL